MGRAKTSSRLSRLDELVGVLKSGDVYVAADLALRLGVSKRTLMRDLDVLREKGYPIDADQGRGGGIWMNPHWGIGRLQLNYKEVIDLLLSLAIAEKIGSPIFLANPKAVRNKVSLSFPQEHRSRIQKLRKRLLIGDPASDRVMDSCPDKPIPAADQIYEAFFEMNILEVTYTDAGRRKTRRDIEPNYLFLSWPVWYVLAWDHLRGDARSFRLDRIASAKNSGTPFKLRAPDLFTKGIEDITSPL